MISTDGERFARTVEVNVTSNAKLRANICELLLSEVGLHSRWTEAGPIEEIAVATLSPEQRTMLGIATCIWGESGSVRLPDVWNELQPDAVTLIGTLLVASAYGDEGLADWLAVHLEDGPGEKPFGLH